MWVLLICLGLQACDFATSTDDRLARAKAAIAAGKVDAALSEVKLIVEKEPSNSAAWLLMARIGLLYGDNEGALRDLDRASATGATPEQIRVPRHEALFAAGRYEDLLKFATTAPKDVPLQVAAANAALALNRPGDAAKMAAQLLASDPRNQSARLLQVRTQLVAGDTATATKDLRTLLEDSPDFAQGWVVKAHISLREGDPQSALEAFEKAQANAKAQLNLAEQATLLAAIIDTQVSVKNIPAAAAAQAKLKALAPQWAMTEFMAARLALLQGDSDAAVGTLQKILVKIPDQPEARLLLGAALLEQGAVEQARTHLTQFIADKPENIEARKLLARLYITLGDTREAERVLTDLPAGVKADPTADWMRSSIMAVSGASAEALNLLEQAAKAAPTALPMQIDLARAYLAANRRDDAKAVLARIPMQKNSATGKRLLVLSRIIGEPEAAARRILSQLATENSRDAEMRTVIGQEFLQANDLEAATEHFHGALVNDSKFTEARLGLAGVAMRKGNLAAAQGELERLLADNARDERAYLALAAIAMRKNDAEQARKWLERAIGVEPSVLESRLALGQLLLREKNFTQADSMLSQAVSVSNDHIGTTIRVGDVQLRAEQYRKAIAAYETAYTKRPSAMLAVRLFTARKADQQAEPEKVLKSWLDREPSNVTVRAVLGEYLLQSGATKAGIAEYERLLSASASPIVLNNLAWAYAKAGDARAEALARRAYEAAPASPAIADTLGWILLEKGRTAEALPLLTKAAQALPKDAEVQAHLARARKETEK
jgi:cellulose synthase operon protein C